MRFAASPNPPSQSRFALGAWLILLISGLVLLAVATRHRIDRVNALTNSPGWSADGPRRDATSATGFARGERTLIVPGQHTPSFWWIMEAQQTAHEHRWRQRQITYDAPPDGRGTNRTAPYRGWLIFVGWIRSLFTGDPLGYSIERGALVADPLLLALLLVGGAAYTARYFGALAGIGFVIGGACLFPLTAGFQPGAPDPHSLAWVLALGSLLPLLVPARFRAASDEHGASGRGHLVIAGIFGGLGLWNDAHTQAPLLLAIALGGLAGEAVRPRDPARLPVVRADWRAWALSGALTTLAASLFEFAPHHVSWSLDAVSPIHAVVWWGFGELLAGAATWRSSGRKGFSRRAVCLVGVGLLAAASWPIVGMLSHSGGLRAPDFYALELTNDVRAISASSLGAWLHEPGDTGAKWATLLPVAIAGVAVVRLILGGAEPAYRTRLLSAVVPAAFIGVLAIWQLRWWNGFDVLVLALLATLLTPTPQNNRRRPWSMLVATLLVLPGALVAFPRAVEGNDVTDITPADAQQLVTRDFSYWLAARRGADRDVLLSTPVFSTAAAYYGGVDVIVSADDANQRGLLAAARMATANTLDEASVLLRSRGVTRVVLPLWDPMVPNLVRAGRNLAADAPLPDDTFFVGLLRWGSPVWMRAMNYVVPASTGLQDFQLASYAVTAPMENDLFLSRLADFFVERGMLTEAQSVAQSLKDYPRSVVALGAIGRVELAGKDMQNLPDTVEKLIPYLSRVTARHLAPDRRISIAMLLTQTRHEEEARSQIATCLKGLDEQTVRTLTPGAVRDLLAMMRRYGLGFDNPALQPAALSLLPPAERPRYGR